ncbi:MAG: FAD-dependent oxidoreductase [Actinobacteria bacterium]|nr:FAD-dependent oxidoreductase [Actinomycetota bacterium]
MSAIHDLIIIGGGAIGIYANQYALKKGLRAMLVEKSDSLGGKLKNLDPQIPLSDVPGADRWTAGQLAETLISQTKKYQPEYVFKERVTGITQKDFVFTINTDKGKHLARSILLTTGRGIFMPKSLAKLSDEEKRKAGILCEIKDNKEVLGKKVVVVGGSQETAGWALQAASGAKSVLIINWRFIKSYGWLEGNLSVPPNMDILEPYGLLELLGDKKVTGIKVFHVTTGEEKTIDTDIIIMARGYLANLNDLENFGVELKKNGIKVTENMHTSRPGIFAAGDCVYYPGKERTVEMGSREAAKAIDSAVKYLQSVWGAATK